MNKEPVKPKPGAAGQQNVRPSAEERKLPANALGAKNRPYNANKAPEYSLGAQMK